MAEPPSLFPACRQLVVLQGVDLEIAGVVVQIEAVPGERAAIASAITTARESIVSLEERLETEELDERRLEGEMRERETLLERLDSQTAQVVSAQAYKALQSEIDKATISRSELETRALELMEAIDALRTERTSEQARLADLEASAPGQLAEIDKRASRHQGERDELLERRGSTCEGIPRDVVSRYDLIAARRQPATLILSGTTCPTCQMAVPAQHAREVHLGQLIYTCASCRRMLLPAEAFEGSSETE